MTKRNRLPLAEAWAKRAHSSSPYPTQTRVGKQTFSWTSRIFRYPLLDQVPRWPKTNSSHLTTHAVLLIARDVRMSASTCFLPIYCLLSRVLEPCWCAVIWTRDDTVEARDLCQLIDSMIPIFSESLAKNEEHKCTSLAAPGDGQQVNNEHVSIIVIPSRDFPSLVFRGLYLEKYWTMLSADTLKKILCEH